MIIIPNYKESEKFAESNIMVICYRHIFTTADARLMASGISAEFSSLWEFTIATYLQLLDARYKVSGISAEVSAYNFYKRRANEALFQHSSEYSSFGNSSIQENMMKLTILALMMCMLLGTVMCWNEGYEHEKEHEHEHEQEGICPRDVSCNNIQGFPSAVACNNLPTPAVSCATLPTDVACNNLPTPAVSCAAVPTAIACAGGTVACSTDCQIVGLLNCIITSLLAALAPIITAIAAFPTSLLNILDLIPAIAALLASVGTAIGILLDPTTGLLACFTGLCPVVTP
ncbi:hypothetical protein NQZ79_g2247 [Umbelopsis isabellina]|nr:hypothetical protein NQZ79_g2247 [Umbelopsis isabellina]